MLAGKPGTGAGTGWKGSTGVGVLHWLGGGEAAVADRGLILSRGSRPREVQY